MPPGQAMMHPGQAMMAPQPMAMMPPNIGGAGDILLGLERVFIVQKVNMIEAVTGGLYEQKNTYYIQDSNGKHLMFVKEKSTQICRQCCAPDHPLELNFYPSVQGMEQYPTSNVPPVMSALKQGCCDKCTGCFACTPSCVDEMQVYEGGAQLEHDLERTCLGFNEFTCCCMDSSPCFFNFPKAANPFTSILEPLGGGGCQSGLSVMSRAINKETDFIWDRPADSIAYVRGPCVFGGCSEYCVDAHFNVESERYPGAAIYKKAPDELKDYARTMFTDSDVYEVVFTPQMNAKDRASLIASALMVDYKFFEDFVPGCMPCPKGCEVESTPKGVKIHITLFKCSVYGCLCPCKVTIPLENDSNN